MMLHHQATDYDQAASAAATFARTKFDAIIAKGYESLQATLERIDAEVPQDKLVPYQKMSFGVNEGRVILDHPDVDGGHVSRPLHRHALKQVAARAEVPKLFAERLLEGSERNQELLAYNLNELLSQDTDRALVRYVNDEARGVLSDKYKRMNSNQLIHALLESAGEYGAIPIEGTYLETRTCCKVVLPYIFEPVPNEVMIYGLAWGNSEFGDGAYWVRSFVHRLWCTNMATLEEELRKVHLGKRLGEDVNWSDATHQLDSATLVSMTKDIVGKVLHPDRVKATMGMIAKANEEKVDPRQIAAFFKKHLRTDEGKQATEIFTSADVENLPPGQTTWRLSNALSFLAGNAPDAGRRLELQEIAGLALKESAAA